MIHGQWASCTITATGKTSTECNLGRVYETVVVLLPTLASGTIAVQGDKETGGTPANIYTYNPADGAVDQMITAATTGGYFIILPIGGFQYLTFVSSVDQTGVTFYCRGVRS